MKRAGLARAAQIQAWFDRKFAFAFPVEQYPMPTNLRAGWNAVAIDTMLLGHRKKS